MPQSQIQGPDENARINLKSSVNSLGHLASGLAWTTWETRHAPSRTTRAFDASARRAIEWHRITEAVVQPYYVFAQKNFPGRLYEVKKKLFLWFSHKHAVLQDALKKGDILQVDVLNAVLEIDILELEKHLGGEPRSADSAFVKSRDQEREEDRAKLEARHAEINKAFEGWCLGHSKHVPEKRSAVDEIYQFAVQHFPRGEIPDVCRSWADDMAETDHRMGNHWTDIERNSLSSFLTCFRKALDTLSAPPRPESAYHPAALQHAADLDKAVKLFVNWNAAAIRTRVVSCYNRKTQVERQLTKDICIKRQFGLASPLFETKPLLDVDIDPSKCTPAWLDDNWYRRLALPSTDPTRDKITSLEFTLEEQMLEEQSTPRSG